MPGGVHENMKAWEPEEDRLIIELLADLGPRWSKISQALPGRSISSIRNRWQRIDKGRKMHEEGKISKNRCQICGQPKRGHVCFETLRQKAAEQHKANDATLAEVLPDIDAMDVSVMLLPSRRASADGSTATLSNTMAELPNARANDLLSATQGPLPEADDVSTAVEFNDDDDGYMMASELLAEDEASSSTDAAVDASAGATPSLSVANGLGAVADAPATTESSGAFADSSAGASAEAPMMEVRTIATVPAGSVMHVRVDGYDGELEVIVPPGLTIGMPFIIELDPPGKDAVVESYASAAFSPSPLPLCAPADVEKPILCRIPSGERHARELGFAPSIEWPAPDSQRLQLAPTPLDRSHFLFPSRANSGRSEVGLAMELPSWSCLSPRMSSSSRFEGGGYLPPSRGWSARSVDHFDSGMLLPSRGASGRSDVARAEIARTKVAGMLLPSRHGSSRSDSGMLLPSRHGSARSECGMLLPSRHGSARSDVGDACAKNGEHLGGVLSPFGGLQHAHLSSSTFSSTSHKRVAPSSFASKRSASPWPSPHHANSSLRKTFSVTTPF